jgi:hypothetical protein
MAQNSQPIGLPNDPRVQHRYSILNGIKYHYLYAEPKNEEPRETVFLVCGDSIQNVTWIFSKYPLLDTPTSVLNGNEPEAKYNALDTWLA